MTGPIIRPGSAAVNVITGASEQDFIGISQDDTELQAIGDGLASSFDLKRDQDIRDADGVNDGATNNGPAMLTMLAAAKNAKRTMPFSLSSDPVGTKTIFLPAGDWVITDPGGMLGQESMTGKARGLRFVGMGDNVTNVIFKPTSAGALIQNDYWQNLTFEHIGFYAATAGCTLTHSSTTHNAQRYRFFGCSFNNFKYNAYLEGSNNNSEWAFINCHSHGVEATGAYLRIPGTGSDQFLNYWWFGGSHWTSDAPLIDADLGGHFHAYGLDVSNWGSGLAAAGYLFNLRGNAHAQGVCSLTVDGLRVEAKNANAALLYSEWPQGNVNIQVDWSSQTGTYTYGDIINLQMQNVAGAVYTFRDSFLAGGVKVAYSTNAFQKSHKVRFRDCSWRQKATPYDVVTYDRTAAGSNTTDPPVVFENCRNADASYVTNAAGQPVWDAILGYRGDCLQDLQLRTLSIRGVYGAPADGTVLTATLPIGALITGFQALAPAGGSAEGSGGAWTLATTEGSPTTIATATIAGAMSAGFDVNVALAVPFECSSTDTAKVTVTPSSVSNNNSKALLLIKGYW